jgi:hypothetical protein
MRQPVWWNVPVLFALLGAPHTALAQTGTAQTATGQTGSTQTGTTQTGTTQTGTAQTGTAPTGTAQTATAETATAQTGTAQTGTAQTGTTQTGTAQTAPSARTPVSLKLPPGITLSGGVGLMAGRDSDNQSVPVFSGSMEIGLNRFFLAQVEVTSGQWRREWTESGRSFQSGAGGSFTGYTGDYVNSYRYRHTTLVGNFLGRVGTERVQALFGAGFGLNFKATESTIANVGCIPTPQISCSVLNFDSDDSETGLVQQLVAGVDVRLDGSADCVRDDPRTHPARA